MGAGDCSRWRPRCPDAPVGVSADYRDADIAEYENRIIQGQTAFLRLHWLTFELPWTISFIWRHGIAMERL